jgi:hypothetical protein
MISNVRDYPIKDINQVFYACFRQYQLCKKAYFFETVFIIYYFSYFVINDHVFTNFETF